MTRAKRHPKGVSSVRAGLVPGVALALALFVGGGVAHVAHHVLDPACDAGRAHAGPCASCAALHGAAATAKHVTLAVPERAARSEGFRSQASIAPASMLGPGAPRAPPLA